MRKVFNMGIGMVAVVPQPDAYRALDVLRTAGHRAAVIGGVAHGTGEVRFTD
jgi:phosphoribosylformylglycinamidine cyclo-ligase